MDDLESHNARIAFSAVFSKMGSPVNLVSVPNSTMNVPTPAVHVTGVSSLGTPYSRLTVPYGIPVDVLKADNTQAKSAFFSQHVKLFCADCPSFLCYGDGLKWALLCEPSGVVIHHCQCVQSILIGLARWWNKEMKQSVPGSSFLAAFSASRRRGPEQGQPGSSCIPVLCESKCADNKPPTTESRKKWQDEWRGNFFMPRCKICWNYCNFAKHPCFSRFAFFVSKVSTSLNVPRIFVSKTETLMSLLKLRVSIKICATRRNSVWLSITASVSKASTRVSE